MCGVQLVTRTKKMFVGGLSATTTAADVKTYFEQFGPVSHLIVLRVVDVIVRVWFVDILI